MKSLATLALATLVLSATQGQDAQAGGRSPVDRTFTTTFHVHKHEWKCVHLTLKRNRRYRVVVEQVDPEVYPAVVNPGFYDMKLRVMRYWKGHRKFDSGHVKGVSRVTYMLTGTHHGDREYKFCVFNAVHKSKKFRLTVQPLR